MQPSITTRRSRFDPQNIRLAAAITGVFVAGMILGGLSREVDIANPFDDDSRPAVVAYVPAQAGDGVLGAQQEGISAGVPAITGGPGDITSFDQSRFQEDNLYLPAVQAEKIPDYGIHWSRFLEANGVTAVLTEPVTSIEQQRFIDENVYMPGYTAVQQAETNPIEDMLLLEQNLYLPTGTTGTTGGPADILTLEQNLYLPSDGNGFVDVEAPAAVVGDRADIKAYYEAELGEGLLGNGKAVDSDATYLRAVGSWVNEGLGEGWFGGGKPVDDSAATNRPVDRGIGLEP